jgi:uncharacterized protein YabE (DUF348 family)
MRHSRPLQKLLSRGLFAGGALVALIGIMAFGYNMTLTPILIVVDGQERVIRTNQRAVETILREAGITIASEDAVGPDLTAELTDNQSTIIVQHARSITVIADGQTHRLRTQSTGLTDILKQAGTSISPYDIVIANNQPIDRSENATRHFAREPGDVSPLKIVVRRAMPITIDVGGRAQPIETAATTVGQALADANIQLYLADHIQPDLNTPITPKMKIEVEQAVPINIDVDGRTLRTRTLRSTLGDVLNDMGVTLIGQDYTQPAIDQAVQAGTTVKVVRVREDVLIEQEVIPFDTVRIADPDMELDTSAEREGESGVQQKRTVIRYEDDQEVARTTDPDFIVLKAPVNKEFRYGTKIVIRTLNTPNGPIEYWRKVRAYATSYSAATSGTPKTAKWYGITATGLPMSKGIVAVDPSVIRLGTKLYVDGYGVGLAGDTGSGVRGRWVDLGYDDSNLQGWWWWVDVYLLTPAPNDIPYTLPNWPTYPDRKR